MQKYTTYFLPSNEYRSSYNNYETEMIFEIKTATLYHGDSYRHENRFSFKVDTEKLTTIDLFTDTAAILNLLDLRSIMGCPGALAQYLRALFGQKENFNVYFSGKRRSLLHPNTAQRSFFPLQYFSRKTERKIGPKSARKY